MFENLSDRFSKMIQSISRVRFLTEDNIKDVLDEVKIALLEADVSLSVVHSFINVVKTKALGRSIHKSLTPSQEFVKIVYDSLVSLMGKQDFSLNLSVQPPAVFFLIGLQGSGKTTTCAKLAKYLCVKQKKKVLVSSVDIYRPFGIKQLEILTSLSGADFFQINESKKMIDIASNAFSAAKLGIYDVLLVDTVGCSSKDVNLVSDLVDLSSLLHPEEIFFIVDAMLGQDAAHSASSFNEKLSLTGIILTKIDGDSRGGAALSIYHTINKPIKFFGTGEKIDALEPFHVSRMARRILGMGDILSLLDDIENKIEKTQIKDTLSKLDKGDTFDLSDFLNQLKQMRNMGGVNQILNKLPIVNNISNVVKSKINDQTLMKMEVVINSMTIEERKYPNLILGSRKRRISYGSGVSINQVNDLLKRFKEVRYIMQKVNKNGLSKMLRTLQDKLSSGFLRNK